MKSLQGKAIFLESGAEFSLTWEAGDFNIMILSDDSCNAKDEHSTRTIQRSQLFVYHKGDKPSQHINEEIFGSDIVRAEAENVQKAFNYCLSFDLVRSK